MQALKETRPFCLDHAKAGAPYACRNAQEATILKWDVRGKFSLIGHFGPHDMACEWTDAGGHPTSYLFDLVMTPLGYIDGKPAFVGDEVIANAGPLKGERTKVRPTWIKADWDKFAWPTTEKQYPATWMTGAELCALWNQVPPGGTGGKIAFIINAGLRHAVDSGQVVATETCNGAINAMAESAIAKRAAYGMAVAEAVQQAAYEAVRNSSAGFQFMAINSLNLSAIIAKVPV
jgi:hypothetical protein